MKASCKLPSQHLCWVGWLLEFYILATPKVILRWVPTNDSADAWRLHSAGLLGHQTANTITWYSTQSHYPDAEPIFPWPILIMKAMDKSTQLLLNQFRLLQIYILATSNDHIRMGINLWQYTLVAMLYCCFTGTSGCQTITGFPIHSHYPDIKSTNQSLPYPSNVKCQSKQWQV